MSTFERIVERVKAMPPEKQAEVLEFVELVAAGPKAQSKVIPYPLRGEPVGGGLEVREATLAPELRYPRRDEALGPQVEATEAARYPLRGIPVTLVDPTEPVAQDDWDAARR